MFGFSNLLVCATILFGIIAQMLLLDIHIKSLEGGRRIFFGVGNLLVLAVNIALSMVLPIDVYMKIYVLVVHIPIFFIFWITTGISAIKVIFALFTAVFLIYPANLMSTVILKTVKWLYPAGFYIAYIATCALILLIIYRFFKSNFNYIIKNYSGLNFIKLSLLPLTYYIANYWLGLYNYDIDKFVGIFTLRTLFL